MASASSISKHRHRSSSVASSRASVSESFTQGNADNLSIFTQATLAASSAQNTVASPQQTAVIANGSFTNFDSNQDLLNVFTRPYLAAHQLSHPSRRYPDYLWFGIITIFVIWSIEHILSRGGYNGSFGALQRKIGIRRFAFGPGSKPKKPSPPASSSDSSASSLPTPMPLKTSKPRKFIPAARRLWTTPTVAQMVSMILMMGGIYAVCFWGDDYVDPDECFWGGKGCALSTTASSPPRTTYAVSKRNTQSDFARPVQENGTFVDVLQFGGVSSTTNRQTAHLPRPMHRRKRHLGHARRTKRADPSPPYPSGYATYNDPLLSVSNTGIHRNLWTSADRIGMIAFALTPLVVTLAMKMWPFAAFAVPFLMSYEFDKTIMYHRWIGIITWTLSTAHTALWIVQLIKDKDPFGRPVLYGMIYYWHFEAAMVAYVSLTLMVVFSFTAIRAKYYEFFYASHMVLGILFLVGCILHFWRAAIYVFIACGIWAGERTCRTVYWLWLNGFTKGLGFSERQSAKLSKMHNQATRRRPLSEKVGLPSPRKAIANRLSLMIRKASGDWSAYPPPKSPSAMSFMTVLANQPAWRPCPPPGFALAQLLPGKNIRLTIRTPSIVHWRTGQYTSLTVPSVNPLQAHPFTIANADERQLRPVDYPIGSEIVLLIGARQGFTKKLWDHIVDKRKMFGPSATSSSGGVLIRAQVSKPLGTAGRARLDDFDTVLIICGGTGVSFGMAAMEHCCMSMAMRDSGVKSPTGRKCKIKRVRFIWIVREFSHLSWVAPAVRRCLDMCPPDYIRIDFFVTRGTRAITPNVSPNIPFNDKLTTSHSPSKIRHKRTNSTDSLSDEEGKAHETGLSKPTQTVPDYQHHEAMDFVLFDGEHQDQSVAETQWSQRVQQEGKLRRARSRKALGGRRHKPARFQRNLPQQAWNEKSHVTVYSEAEKDPFENVTSDLIDQYANDLDEEERYADADTSRLTEDIGTPLPFYSKQTGDVTFNDSIVSLDDTKSTRSPAIKQDEAGPFREDDLDLDVSTSEMDDLHIISELARTGHPDVKAVMLEEQEKSEGKMIVACCGPVALNINIRRLVADMIDPIRVAKGDQRGQVAL